MSAGKSSTSSPYAPILAGMASKLFKQTDPVIKQLMGNFSSILSGDIFNGGNLPFAQRAVSASRQAAGSSMAGADAYLAKLGLDKSPFGAAIKGQLEQQGEENVANAPVNVAESMLGMLPGTVTPLTGQAMSGMGTAGSLVGNAKQSGADLGSIIQGGAQVGAAALI